MIAYLRRMKELAGVGLLLVALGGCAERDAGAGKPDCPPVGAAMKESLALTTEGAAQLRNRQLDAAIATLRRATAAAPDNADAWYHLGAADEAADKVEDAAKAYERAAALDPDVAMYQLRHGVALAMTAQAEPAKQALRTAIALEPRLYRAHYTLGRILRDEQDAAGAAAAFTQALTYAPREPDLYLALGELYRRWELLDPAIQVLTQGVANAAGDTGQLPYALGVARYDHGQYAEAVEALTRALAADPGNLGARFQRGMAYVALGDAARARADLEAYVQAATDDASRTVAAAAIAKLVTR